MRFNFLSKSAADRLPRGSGVYVFKSRSGQFLYLGKAADIKERVKNHFKASGTKENLFLKKTDRIGFISTDSEIEALLLEANLIKKYMPKYNVLWRDDKNYFYVGITKETLPRVFLTHQTKSPGLKTRNQKPVYIGPFVDGRALKKAFAILRKSFPYYTLKKHPLTLCPWCHLELCPGPTPNPQQYRKNIQNLIAILSGKKKNTLDNLQREMQRASRMKNFEKAAKIRDRLSALEKTLANARIFTPQTISRRKLPWQYLKKEFWKILERRPHSGNLKRVEAYDIAHIHGQEATGSMVTFIKGNASKDFYRKFRIRLTSIPDDLAMTREVIARRLRHPEWPLPDLILIDGGKAQMNAAVSEIKRKEALIRKEIMVVALSKRGACLYIPGKKNPIPLRLLPQELENFILRVNSEAHRFARTYHHHLRDRLIGQNTTPACGRKHPRNHLLLF